MLNQVFHFSAVILVTFTVKDRVSTFVEIRVTKLREGASKVLLKSKKKICRFFQFILLLILSILCFLVLCFFVSFLYKGKPYLELIYRYRTRANEEDAASIQKSFFSGQHNGIIMSNFIYFQYIWLHEFQQNAPILGKFLGAVTIQERPLLVRVRQQIFLVLTSSKNYLFFLYLICHFKAVHQTTPCGGSFKMQNFYKAVRLAPAPMEL